MSSDEHAQPSGHGSQLSPNGHLEEVAGLRQILIGYGAEPPSTFSHRVHGLASTRSLQAKPGGDFTVLRLTVILATFVHFPQSDHSAAIPQAAHDETSFGRTNQGTGKGETAEEEHQQE